NIGFEVVDLVERSLERSTGWRAGKGEYYFAKGFAPPPLQGGLVETQEILLVKPTTYMNLSGRAIRDALQFYKVPMGQLVVISDDIALPLGTLRLRLGGSDGGHNGLSSIIYELGTEDFARLRCGIGAGFHKGEQVRFVLSKFKPDEIKSGQEMIERAAQSCFEIVASGITKAMNVVNAKQAAD
ncbi:MAG TPA: aminoacyl-tRNA hydrolase, partial [Candidatus Kapabacteria bacterium]|nr:aminoacyl-tRNA hydrolase [Candidatus Kapabacteria bacterium]